MSIEHLAIFTSVVALLSSLAFEWSERRARRA